MKLRFLSPVASIIVAAASLAAQTSILPFLPKDTMMAVSAPDLLTSIKDFGQMPLAKMWAEEEVQNFFADTRELLTKQLNKAMEQGKAMHAQGQLPFDPAELLQLRVRTGTFAVTSMAITKGAFGPQPNFGVVLHLDFGDSAPAWNKLIQSGLGLLEQQAADNLTKTETKVGDVTMISMTAPGGEMGGMALNVAMIPGGILIGTLGDEVRGILESMKSKAPALGATAHYASTAKHLTVDGAEMEMFFRLKPGLDFVVSALQTAKDEGELEELDVDGVKRAIAAMGMNDIGAMGATSKYEGGKSISRSFVGHSKEAAATVAQQKPLDMSFLKWVPKDAISFSSSTLDAMSLYNMLQRGLEAYDPEFAKQALGQLAEIEKQMGFSVRNDLFGSLGDHYIDWWMPVGSIASPPEVALLLKVTDEAKIINVLKGIARMSDGTLELEEGEKRGIKVYQVRLNMELDGAMGGMNPFELFQPSFAFKNGYLVAGFSVSDIKRAFTRMDREDDPKGDIRANKEFVAVQAGIPGGINSVSFTDWKIQFENLYQVVTGALAFLPLGDDVPIDMQLLPESGTLTKHLFGALSYSKTDAAGTQSVSTSPFGPEVALFAAGLVVAGLGMVASVRGNF